MTQGKDLSESDYLRPGPAAQRLGVDVRTLARMADAGRIGAIVLPGGHRRYNAHDIESIEQGAA